MPDKKKRKAAQEQQTQDNKPLEVELSLSAGNKDLTTGAESQAWNTDLTKTKTIDIDVEIDYGYYTDIHTETFTNPNYNALNLEALQTYYKENGNDAAKTYNYLKDFINENKDNPELLQQTVSEILGNFSEHYDNGKHLEAPGDNIIDQFDKILNLKDNEELKGFMCESMHYTMMKALNDCGIEAVTLCVGEKTQGLLPDDSIGHAILLYKNSNGEYVVNNYGNTTKINAKNIVDAAKELIKTSPNSIVKNPGTITLLDEKHQYQTYVLDNVAAFGKEIADKGIMNKPGAPVIQSGSKVSANFDNNSSDKTATLGATFANQAGTVSQTFELEGKKTEESDVFNSSSSVGMKYGVAKNWNLTPQTKLYADNTAIVSNVSGSSQTLNPKVTYDAEAIQNYVDFLTRKNPVERLIEPVTGSSSVDCSTFHSDFSSMPHSLSIDVEGSSTLSPSNVDYSLAGESVGSITSSGTSIGGRLVAPTIEIKHGNETYQYHDAGDNREAKQEKTNLVTISDNAKVGIETEIADNGTVKVDGVSQIQFKGDMTLGNGISGEGAVTLEQGAKALVKPTEDVTIGADASAGVVLTGAIRNNYEGFYVQPGFKGTGGVDLTWQPAQHLDIGASVSGGIFTDAASTATAYSVGASASYKPGENAPTIFANGQYSAQHEQLHLGNFDEAIRNNNSFRVQLGTKFNNNSQLSLDYTNYRDALHSNQNGHQWTFTYRKTF